VGRRVEKLEQTQFEITSEGAKAEILPVDLQDPDAIEKMVENEILSQHHANQTAVGRNGVFSDLDGAVVFLTSRSAVYVTGQILPVDGGYLVK